MANVNRRILSQISLFLDLSDSKLQDIEKAVQEKVCAFRTSIEDCLDRLTALSNSLEQESLNCDQEDRRGRMESEIQEISDLCRRLEFHENQLESKNKDIVYQQEWVQEFFNKLYPEARSRLELYDKQIRDFLKKD